MRATGGHVLGMMEFTAPVREFVHVLDAVEFCRILSGRGTGEGLLSRHVPF